MYTHKIIHGILEEMFRWINGGACVSLIFVSTAYKISDGPIFAAAIKHLNNPKSVRLGIDSIELISGLVILASVVMRTTLKTSTALRTALSVLVTNVHLAVGLTRAKQSFSRSLCPTRKI